MIGFFRPAHVVVAVVAAAACAPLACTSSEGTASPGPDAGPGLDGGADACGGPLAIAVEPSKAQVLTCTTLALTAKVTGTCTPGATWTATGGGTIDANGLYTAPKQVPSPASATVTAAALADATKTAASAITLSTALPQAPTSPGKSSDEAIFHDTIAASGKRVYAVLRSVDRSNPDQATYGLNVAASSDGGATWSTPVKATDVPDAKIAIEAPSIAVDAGDPETVYVAYTLRAGKFAKTSAPTLPDSGETLALAVSKDGGKTFTSYVLESRVSGWEAFAMVASPAPGTVTVEAPLGVTDPGLMRTYVDGNKGAGFASFNATEFTVTAVHDVKPGRGGALFNTLKSNGGSAGLESPRLVADGKGNVCLTYVGGFESGVGDDQTRLAVQCSKDSGATFGAPVDLELEAAGKDLHHPTGAFGASGQLAVAWWKDGIGGNALELAQSKDGGKTFGAPSVIPRYALPPAVGVPGIAQYPGLAWTGDTLWVTYLVSDGVGPNRLVVDKSCDGGTTWSGAQLVNGPEPAIADGYSLPGIFVADGKPHAFARKGSSVDDVPVDVFRLVP